MLLECRRLCTRPQFALPLHRPIERTTVAVAVANFRTVAFAALALAAHGAAWSAPSRVVIVIEENKSYEQIIGSRFAPYINSLARKGALFTRSYAVTHPSQPNYLALFSGDTHGVADNRCPVSLSGANLASELAAKKLNFAIYSESLPSAGYTGCESGNYRRKHNPAVNWQGNNVSPGMNLPFSDFPRNYSSLPAVSLVIPDQRNDMHDGRPADAIRAGDDWLKNNIDPYIKWAEDNNGLFILTWDEDGGASGNHIATIFVGPTVRPGRYNERIDHYSVLRSLLDLYGLRPIGKAAASAPITSIWKR